MTFSALVGAGSHFAVGSLPDPMLLFLCVMFTLIFAMFASKIANKAAPRVLNRLVGIILLVIGVGIGIIQLFKYVI
jgi:small neutral amino acid transporter SnatA (MarC family)